MASVPSSTPGDNGNKGEQIRGFASCTTEVATTLFRFHNALLFQQERRQRRRVQPRHAARQVEAFMFASTAPGTGRRSASHVTRPNAAASTIHRSADRPGRRGECDLVGQRHRGRRATRAPTAPAPELSKAIAPTSRLCPIGTLRPWPPPRAGATYTFAPTNGRARGVDRDEDGAYDRTRRTRLPTRPTRSVYPSRAPTAVCSAADAEGVAATGIPPARELAASGQWVVTPSTPASDLATNGMHSSHDCGWRHNLRSDDSSRHGLDPDAAGTSGRSKTRRRTRPGITKGGDHGQSQASFGSMSRQEERLSGAASDVTPRLVVVLRRREQGPAGQCASVRFNGHRRQAALHPVGQRQRGDSCRKGGVVRLSAAASGGGGHGALAVGNVERRMSHTRLRRRRHMVSVTPGQDDGSR